jgi:hypothetical protein
MLKELWLFKRQNKLRCRAFIAFVTFFWLAFLVRCFDVLQQRNYQGALKSVPHVRNGCIEAILHKSLQDFGQLDFRNLCLSPIQLQSCARSVFLEQLRNVVRQFRKLSEILVTKYVLDASGEVRL